jgi:dihydroflavonol-4-reductase
MRAYVTGATGFVGSAVARRLLSAGHEVRALARPGSPRQALAGLPVDWVEGDLRGSGPLPGLAGCDWVFHVAALYSYWGHRWDDFYQANVEGTRRVMEAARVSGAARIVYTSSVAVLGLTKDGSPADETTPSTLADMIGDYKRSKFLAEGVVRECVDRGLPAVIVNPSTPVGVGDHKPTPTGKIIVDFLNGRMPAYSDTGLNIVDVDDVAAGHLLAAERGRVGERYLLGNENLTLKRLLDVLADISGRPPVRMRAPHALALAWAYIDVALARLLPRHTPAATPDTARLSRKMMYFTAEKAVRELGLPQTPVRDALLKAVEWYRAHGYAPRGAPGGEKGHAKG